MLTRIYRAVAAAAACLLAAVGALVLAVVAPVALVGVVAMGSIGGLVIATHLPGVGVPAPARHRLAGVGAAAAALVTAALLAMAGIAAVLGAAAAPVFLVLLAGAGGATWHHRAAWRAYARAVAHTAARPPAPAPPAPPPAAPAARPPGEEPPADAVTDAPTVRALCLAWHRSHWSLRDMPVGPARAELITTRGRLLDELERRDPAGFRRWLQRGVRSSDDPGHYLTDTRLTEAPQTPTGPPRRDDDRRAQ